MKELSIEEKARRYNEAIEKAKVVIEQNPLMEYLKKGIEYILPELKESEEDERIMKAIKKALQVRCDGSRIISDEPVTLEEAIAWLEKQGDKTAWSEDDETGLTNTIIMLKEGASLHFNKKDITKAVDWLKSLRPQSQWKPSDEQMKALELAIRCGIQLGTWEEEALKSLKEQLFKLKLKEE